jgi:DNA-binding transcriptional LysR family regulator
VLAHAEQQLGYLLFDRVKGKLVPTPEAHRLFTHVSTVFTNVERLRHVAENLKSGDSGHVRVASTPAFGLEVLPNAVASFRKMHADTFFEIETLHLDEMTQALLESRVDIGLAFESSAIPGIEQQTLASSRFVVLAPSDTDFGGKISLTAADLRGHPFIGMNSRGPLGRSLSIYLGSLEADLDIVIRSETYHVAKALVRCGSGVTIADEITARSGGCSNIQVLPLQPELRFNIQALQLAAVPLSIASQNFVKHLSQSLHDFLAR